MRVEVEVTIRVLSCLRLYTATRLVTPTIRALVRVKLSSRLLPTHPHSPRSPLLARILV